MDIEQIRIARREMEDAVQAAATEAVYVFHAKTGMSPQSINAQLLVTSSFGERELQYMVGKVRADVPL